MIRAIERKALWKTEFYEDFSFHSILSRNQFVCERFLKHFVEYIKNTLIRNNPIKSQSFTRVHYKSLFTQFNIHLNFYKV